MNLKEADWLRCLNWRWFAVVVIPLLWALAYLPELGARDLRLEEGRRATPAREMLQTGDFITPRLYGEPYLNKPPGYFWLVAGVGAIQGKVDSLTVRVPSVMAILIGALIVAYFPDPRLNRATRNLAALFLLASVACLDKGVLGEIDATLSTMIAGAVAIWWHGESRGHVSTRHWLFAALVLSCATLTKGPPALVLFYVPLLTYLIVQKRLKALFSPGHLACVVLVLAPFVMWILLLQNQTGYSFYQLMNDWRAQMGADGAAVGNQQKKFNFVRYFVYPLELVSGFLPWALALIALLFKRARQSLDMPQSLYRYLLCSLIAVTLFFWLWPIGRPRHMMAAIFPLCLLAAAVVMNASSWPRGAGIKLHLHSARMAASLCAITGVVTLILSVLYYRPVIIEAVLLAIMGIVLAVWLFVSAEKSWRHNPTLALAANWGIVLLLVWSAVAIIFWPVKADGAGAHRLYFTKLKVRPDEPRAIVSQFNNLPPENIAPRYTMIRSHGLAEGFFNIVFYFGEHLSAARIEDLRQPQLAGAVVFLSEKQYAVAKINAEIHLQELSVAKLDRRRLADGSTSVVAVRVLENK